MCLVCFPVCLALFCLSSGLLGLGLQEVHAEVKYAGGDAQVGCSSGGSAWESVEGSWFSSLLSLLGVMVMAQKTFQAEVECSFHKKSGNDLYIHKLPAWFDEPHPGQQTIGKAKCYLDPFCWENKDMSSYQGAKYGYRLMGSIYVPHRDRLDGHVGCLTDSNGSPLRMCRGSGASEAVGPPSCWTVVVGWWSSGKNSTEQESKEDAEAWLGV